MNDQASRLRAQVSSARFLQANKGNRKEAKAIAVVSGKGGVGKSNFSLNFSLALQKKGYRVLLFDMDIGMANIDVLMGRTQRHSLVHLFDLGLTMPDIIQKGPENLSYIAGGSGLKDIFNFSSDKRAYFLSQLQEITLHYDYILFDMGAGITDESLQIVLSSNEIFLVTTCEPTSLTDAYSALKFIHSYDENIPFHLIINKALNKKQAENTADRLQTVSTRFLNKNIKYQGSIPDDKSVSQAVMEQIPFVLKFPSSYASMELYKLTARYLQEISPSDNKNISSFMTKLRRLFG
jgi:flagellar biosynthesis protein FlhG